MIITCPNCGRKFVLKHKPGKTFICPKCSYRTAFNLILNGTDSISDKVTNTSTMPTGPQLNEKTTLMEPSTDSTVYNLPSPEGEKTQLVAGLQKPKPACLQLSFRGLNLGERELPVSGQFTLGRNSNDSTAQIQLTPDQAMSRVHAGMRVLNKEGGLVYQMTSMKDHNPVYVNTRPVRKGEPVTLHSGDTIRMGDTTAIFRIK